MKMNIEQHCGIKQHQEMMAKMKATDEQLLRQVESLAGASTEAKVDLLTAIVTALVQDRSDMHSRMGMMDMMDMPMSPDQIDQPTKMQSIAKEPGDEHSRHTPKATE